jgi:hypothetical protein
VGWLSLRFKQQNKNMTYSDPKLTLENSLGFFFEEINALKRQLNPKNTVSRKKNTKKS